MDHHLNYKSYNIVRRANQILKHIDPRSKAGQAIMKLMQGIVKDSVSLDGDLVDLES